MVIAMPQMPMKVVLGAEKLKDAVKTAIPEAVMTEDICVASWWLDIKKGKKHVVVEIREAGYGVSDLDKVDAFEGPEDVYEHPEEALKKIDEILKKA